MRRIVLILFVVVLLSSFILASDISINATVNNSEPILNESIALLVNISNSNATENFTDGYFFVNFNNSFVEFLNISSPNPNNITATELVWYINISNNSYAVFQVEFKVINDSGTQFDLAVENASFFEENYTSQFINMPMGQPPGSIFVSKQYNPGPSNLGDVVNFSINVSYDGEGDINVTIIDVFDNVLMNFSNSSLPNFVAVNGNITWLSVNVSNMSDLIFDVLFVANGSGNTVNYVLVVNASQDLSNNNASAMLGSMGPGGNIQINKQRINNDIEVNQTAMFRINVSNDGVDNLTSITMVDLYDSSRLVFDTANILPNANSTGQLNWTFDINSTQEYIFWVNFTANGSGSALNNVTLYNSSADQQSNSFDNVNINAPAGGGSPGNYTNMWSNAQPAQLFTDNPSRFTFSSAPYVARGPACSLSNLASYESSSPGYNCCSGKSIDGNTDGCSGSGDVAFDTGAVWVQESGEYIAWKIAGEFHKRSNMSVCDNVNKDVAFAVEFDIDDNVNTGCDWETESCYPGSDYQLWFFPDTNTTLFGYYNGSDSDGISFVANTTASANDIWVYYNCSVDLGGENSTVPLSERGITIIANKSAFNETDIRLNFETNTFNHSEAATNPIDLLTNFGSGQAIDAFAFGGPNQDQGACYQFDGTNKSNCEGQSDFSCVWKSLGNGDGLCDPDFRSFSGAGCFEYSSQGDCDSDANNIGYCEWITGTFPLENGTIATGLCTETFNPFELGGGDCDSECGFCFTQTQCENSESNGGADWGGCGWYSDDYSGIGFCEIKNLKFGCAQNALHCQTASDCTGNGNYWNSTLSACLPIAGAEFCYDQIDNDANGLIDCDDDACQYAKSCASNINTLAGDFKGLSIEDALLGKLIPENPEIHVIKEDVLGDSDSYTDLINVMMVVTDLGMGIGAKVANTTDLVVCGGANTNRTVIFGIDSDANLSSGCNITANSIATTGYEYIAKLGNFNTTNSSAANKILYACVNNSWVVKDGVVLNPGPSEMGPPLACEPDADLDFNARDESGDDGTLAVVLDKVDIGNPKEDVRISVYIVNESYGIVDSFNSYDQITNAYYTPGTVGFTPVDCSQEPSKCGAGFLLVGGGEFMPFEDCFAPGDEDLDGDVNCNDLDCSFAPQCVGLSTYNISSDKTTPKVKSSKSEEYDDAAFIKWTNNEPTNGTILFYGNSASCVNLNQTIVDFGIVDISQDDFKSYHGIDLTSETLGFSLTPDTTYYYKIKSVDRANNSGLSKCLNLTTNSNPSDLSVILNFTAIGGNDFLSNLSVVINDQPLTVGGANILNSTSFRNVNLTFENPQSNATNNWSITLIGADFTEGSVYDFSDSFVVNNTGSLDVVGMDSLGWLEVAQKLGVDYFEVRVPDTGVDLLHCADNGTDCENVTGEPGVELLDTQSEFTVWKVPSTIGFSTYSVTSSGSGSTNTSFNGTMYSYTEFDQFSANGSDILVNITINSTNVTQTINVTLGNASIDAIVNSILYWNGSDWIDENQILMNDSNQFVYQVNVTSTTNNVTTVEIQFNFTNASGSSLANLSHYLYLDGIATAPSSSSNTQENISISYFSNLNTSTTCTAYFSGVASGTIDINATGTIPFNGTWALGANNYYVECDGNNGVVTSTALTMTILDVSNPGVTINSPTTNQVFNETRSVTFNISIDEVASSAFVAINGTNFSLSTNDNISWVYTNSSMLNGSYLAYFYVNDSSGNNNYSESVSFVVAYNVTSDTSNPGVTINSPTATTYASSTISVNITLDEIGSAVLFNLSNGSLYTTNTSDNLEFTSSFTMADTTTTLTIIANDSSGNINDTQTVTFTVDTTPPTITINHPANNSKYSSNSFIFNITLDEVGQAIVSDGTTNFSMSTSDSLTFTFTGSVGEGNNLEIIFYANDSVGNEQSKIVYFSVDTTNPQVTIIAPFATVYNDSDILFNISSNENLSSALVDIAGTNYTLSSINNVEFNYTAFGLADGNYTTTFYVNDTVNNSNNSASVNFAVDTTAPALALSAPGNTSFIASSQVFNISIVDTTAVTANYTINGTTTAITNFTFTPFSAINTNGQYTFSVSAGDEASNTATTQTFTYFVDVTAPTMNVTTISSSTPSNFLYIANDSFGNISNVWFEFNGIENITLNASEDKPIVSGSLIGALYPGSHSLVFYANDTVGNSGSQTLSVDISGRVNLTQQKTFMISQVSDASASFALANGSLVDGTGEDSYNNTALQNISYGITLNQSVPLTINFTGVNGSRMFWNRTFTNATDNDSTLVADISNEFTTTPLVTLNIVGQRNIFPSNSYEYISVLFDIDPSGFTDIYYFTDAQISYDSKTDVNLCAGGNYSDGDTLPCWTNSSNKIKVYLSSFSTVVIANDTIGPNISVISPNSTHLQSEFTPTINVSADAVSCSLYYNNTNTNYTGTLNASTGICTFAPIVVTDGANGTLNFSATDANNNTDSGLFYFNFSDTSAPVATITAPSNGSTVTSTSVTLSVTMNERSTVTQSYNGGSFTSCISDATIGSCTVSGLSDGSRNISINVVDLSGNSAIFTVYFTVNIPDDDENSGGGSGGSSSSSSPSSSSSFSPSDYADEEDDDKEQINLTIDNSQKNYSTTLSLEEDLVIRINDTITVTFKGKEYLFSMIAFDDIKKTITLNLNGESIGVAQASATLLDTDDDGEYDVQITLKNLVAGRAQVVFSKPSQTTITANAVREEIDEDSQDPIDIPWLIIIVVSGVLLVIVLVIVVLKHSAKKHTQLVSQNQPPVSEPAPQSNAPKKPRSLLSKVKPFSVNRFYKKDSREVEDFSANEYLEKSKKK